MKLNKFVRIFSRSLTRFPLASDLTITSSGKVLTAVGQGGRSSRTGYTATVFGSTGFLGRLLTSKLAKHGTITVAPFRNGTLKRQLKVNGDLGVVNFMELDIRNLKSIEDSVAKSDIVFNLIGADYNTKNFTMADVNIELTRRIAQASKDAGVSRFVHVSSYNANPDSESVFYATKGIGEQIVREIIPDSTIVRPGPMYGRNSAFLNELVKIRVLGGNVIFQKKIYPVHGMQVAELLEKIGYDDSTAGQTYELYGTQQWSKQELRAMIGHIIHIGQRGYYPAAVGWYLPAPEVVVKWLAILRQYISSQPQFNVDQLTRVHIDHQLSTGVKTFLDLGMIPEELNEYLYRYVKPYIFHESQVQNRTVYSKEDIDKLRLYVNGPKDFTLFGLPNE